MKLLLSRAHTARLALFASGIFVVAGCGSSAEYELAPVSGVVMLDGKPVPYTRVIFIPQGTPGQVNPGPGSTAACDDAGKFQLKTVRGEDGAVVGKHAIQISSTGPPRSTSGDTDAGPPSKEVFPPEFNASSTLTFEVPAGGTTAADFKLTSRP